MDNLATRKELKRLLRAPMSDGRVLSNGQIDALLRDGHKGLIGATAAENEQLKERLELVNAGLRD